MKKLGFVAVFIATALILFATYLSYARADDLTAGEAARAWFEEQVVRNCCGKGDAYEADYWVDRDRLSIVVTITDGSERCFDLPKGGRKCRHPIPDGTKIFMHKDNVHYEPKNPTGHGVAFVQYDDESDEFLGQCYFFGDLY
jgi:hypothetical protein